MYSVFDNLPEDKKNNIIKCALKEFANNGYEKTSTNKIVKEAGISKGILFHYFKTKKELYKYIVFYSIDIMYSKMLELMDFKSDDYFDRMLEVSAIKTRIMLENPEVYTIVVNIYKSNEQEIIKDLYDKYMPLISEYYKKLNDGMDMSKFKDGTDINKLNEVITWVAEGITNKLVKNISNKAEDIPRIRHFVEDEFFKYMEILKYGVYK